MLIIKKTKYYFIYGAFLNQFYLIQFLYDHLKRLILIQQIPSELELCIDLRFSCSFKESYLPQILTSGIARSLM